MLDILASHLYNERSDETHKHDLLAIAIALLLITTHE